MSFGNKVGRAFGVVGALALEGAVRGATGLGQFGSDVIEGAEQGYNEKHSELLITRAAAEAARKAKREAFLAEHAQAMTVIAAVEPVVAPVVAPVKATRKVRA